MEKSSSQATQVSEPPPPASLPLPTTDLPLPPKSSAQISTAMDLDGSPASQPAHVPAPPSIATTDPSSRGRKRPLEGNLQLENSNYYKMRLLLKDIHPHVLEVLRTPDFKNCKAAIEIQEKMKLMLQLYQDMIGESLKREKKAKGESLSSGRAINETPHTTTTAPILSETEKHNSDGAGIKVGDTVVGGSAFGWNFITYGGTEPAYCGMSKEEYRSTHPIIQVEAELELNNTV